MTDAQHPLRRYGRHDLCCAHYWSENRTCNCGLAEALAEAEAPSTSDHPTREEGSRP